MATLYKSDNERKICFNDGSAVTFDFVKKIIKFSADYGHYEEIPFPDWLSITPENEQNQLLLSS